MQVYLIFVNFITFTKDSFLNLGKYYLKFFLFWWV
jgi:hypothetical protein